MLEAVLKRDGNHVLKNLIFFIYILYYFNVLIFENIFGIIIVFVIVV